MNSQPPPGREELLELAFAIAAREPLEPRLAQLREAAQADPDTARLLAEMIGLVLALRGNRGDAAGHDCLSDETIAAYYEDALPPGERARAETHFARCPLAVRKLVQLHDVMEDLRRETARPAALVLRMLQRGLAVAAAPLAGTWEPAEPAPALLAPDQPEDAQPVRAWRRQLGGVNILLQVIHDTPESCTLALAATAAEPGAAAEHKAEAAAEPEPEAAMQATLRREGRVLQSEPLAPGQTLTFTGLQHGRYELTLASTQSETLQIDLLPHDAA